METGQRLEFFRVKSGHTQESLAAETKISRVTIASIENGRSSPTVATLAVLVRGCGITLGEFFQEYGPRNIPDEHRDLFKKLQEILVTDERAALGITINIEYLYGHMLDVLQQEAERRQQEGRRKRADLKEKRRASH